MRKQTTRIELSKLFSIEIDDDMNVIDCICNWDTDNDDISIYSEEIRVVSNEKVLDADMVEIYNEHGDIDTVFYIVYLFDPTLIPSKNKIKRRKSKNKRGIGVISYFLMKTLMQKLKASWEITQQL